MSISKTIPFIKLGKSKINTFSIWPSMPLDVFWLWVLLMVLFKSLTLKISPPLINSPITRVLFLSSNSILDLKSSIWSLCVKISPFVSTISSWIGNEKWFENWLKWKNSCVATFQNFEQTPSSFTLLEDGINVLTSSYDQKINLYDLQQLKHQTAFDSTEVKNWILDEKTY